MMAGNFLPITFLSVIESLNMLKTALSVSQCLCWRMRTPPTTIDVAPVSPCHGRTREPDGRTVSITGADQRAGDQALAKVA